MKNIFTVFFLSISLIAVSQEVKDIVTKQNDDKIDVFFKISDADAKQVFSITLFGAFDGKERVVLKSVTGDVGDNIPGGKESYKISWDVLKDVDELNSAEFFVKIEMKKDDSKPPAVKDIIDRKWVVGYNGSGFMGFGARASFLNKWGGYAALRSGTRWVNSDMYYTHIYYYYSEADFQSKNYGMYNAVYDSTGYGSSGHSCYSLNFGITKRLLNKTLKIHYYFGIGIGSWGTISEEESTDYYEYWVEGMAEGLDFYNEIYGNFGHYERVEHFIYKQNLTSSIDYEAGFYITYKRISLNLGLSMCFGDTDFVFGLGYKF